MASRSFHAALVFALLAATCAALSIPCSSPESYRVPDGRDYRGTKSTTKSGRTCQRWDSNTPHVHTETTTNGVGAHNYCRNPFNGQSTGPGCFTTDPKVRYELCDVGPPCDPTAAPLTLPVTSNLIEGSHLRSPVTVILATGTDGATIHYTIDGSNPDKDSPAYTTPFVVDGTGARVIRAFAVKHGHFPSDIAQWTVFLALPRLDPVGITPVQGKYIPSKPVLVTLTKPPGASRVMYAVTAADGTALFALYQTPFWVKSTATVLAYAEGDGRDHSHTATMRYELTVPRAAAPMMRPLGTTRSFGAIPVRLSSALAFPHFSISVNGSAMTRIQRGSHTDTANGFEIVPGVRVVETGHSPLLRVEAAGTTTLSAVVEDSDTQPSPATTATFTVVAMPTITFSPPAGTFGGPTQVTVATTSPIPLIVSVNGKRSSRFITLDDVGTFKVTAHAKTEHAESAEVVAIYSLVATALQPPVVLPFSAWSPAQFASPLAIRFEPTTTMAAPEANLPLVSTHFAYVIRDMTSGTVVLKQNMSTELANPMLPFSVAVSGQFRLTVTTVADSATPFLTTSTAVSHDFRITGTGEAVTPYVRFPHGTLCAVAIPAAERALAIAPTAVNGQSTSSLHARIEAAFCSPFPFLRVAGLQGSLTPAYFGRLVGELVNQTSTLAMAVSRVAGSAEGGRPVMASAKVVVKDCVASSIATFSPGIVTPAECAAKCTAASSTATQTSVLLTLGGRCSCATAASLPPVPAAQCNAVCSANPVMQCGASVASTGGSVAATQYAVFPQVGLQPVAYSWTAIVASNAGSAPTLHVTTTTPFSMQVASGNVPHPGGVVKVVRSTQTCRALAAEFVMSAAGSVADAIIRTAGSYKVCVSFGTSGQTATEFLPALSGAVLHVTSGYDIPVDISPPTGVFTTQSVTVTVNSSAASGLIVTVDDAAAKTIHASTYTFTVTGYGVHTVTAVAMSSETAIGSPITRVLHLVDPNATTPAPNGTSTPAPGSGPTKTAQELGLLGYQATATGGVASLRMETDGGTAMTELYCAGSNAAATSRRVVAAAGEEGAAPVDGVLTKTCLVAVVLPPASWCAGVASSDLEGYGGLAPLTLSRVASTKDIVADKTFVINAEMTRAGAVVCVGSATSDAPFVQVPVLEGRLPLSVATAGAGQCTVDQQQMCHRHSACSRRTVEEVDQVACLCPVVAEVNSTKAQPASSSFVPTIRHAFAMSAGAAAYGVGRGVRTAASKTATDSESSAPLSVFCTDASLLPTPLRSATFWNGTVFDVPLSAADKAADATPEPTGIPEAPGSYASLFVLVLLFAVATGALCYLKLPGDVDEHASPHPEVEGEIAA